MGIMYQEINVENGLNLRQGIEIIAQDLFILGKKTIVKYLKI
jgi:hypothetical protein